MATEWLLMIARGVVFALAATYTVTQAAELTAIVQAGRGTIEHPWVPWATWALFFALMGWLI